MNSTTNFSLAKLHSISFDSQKGEIENIISSKNESTFIVTFSKLNWQVVGYNHEKEELTKVGDMQYPKTPI